MIKKLALWAVVILILLAPLSANAVARYNIIMLGDKDEYVLKLQKELYARGYLETEPTGYFGVETQHALMRYQERNGIKADGKAGVETQKKIYGKNYKAIPSSRIVTDNSKDTSKDNGKDDDDTPKTTQPSSTGFDMRNVQIRLKLLGYYDSDKITDSYSPETQEAVRAFQKANDLKVDGVVGASTYQAIFAITAKAAEDAEIINEIPIDSDEIQPTEVIKEETQAVSAAVLDKAVTLIEFGKKQLGKGYRSGAEGPSSFDCSGFVYYCLRNTVGIKPPRSSTDQSRYEGWLKITDKSALRMGDIVFFKTAGHPNDVGHSGIYIGEGKFIHSSSGKGVIISDLSVGYYLEHYQWARRALA